MLKTRIYDKHRAQRETPPNTDPIFFSVLPYKTIHSPYRENTGSAFGRVSRCDLDYILSLCGIYVRPILLIQ